MVAFVPAALLAVAAIANTAYAQTPSCARTYTVQSGDFCDKISAAQNASTFQLADANKGVIDAACDNLFIGETICLGLTGEDCSTVAVVQDGDTCATITSAAGIQLSTLLANNPNVDANCDNIYVGEVLCTASTVIVGGSTTTTIVIPTNTGTVTATPVAVTSDSVFATSSA
ncbi:hypothetical protein QCA50_008408 [Cerrena zonata]|uniref:LysM domain-containing protein n=1 Tax=Cerrena zonata TaxID=2478898 RepID=A0AAW0GDL0_9APHY